MLRVLLAAAFVSTPMAGGGAGWLAGSGENLALITVPIGAIIGGVVGAK